jgi:hypothetical protein
MSDTNTITINPLRKMLQTFNSDLGVYINEDQRFKLGKVLTIIDAAIADPAQRKAIKDLVQDGWWVDHNKNRMSENPMTSPHTDLRAICKVLGFDLYEPSANELPKVSNNEQFAQKRYTKVSKED